MSDDKCADSSGSVVPPHIPPRCGGRLNRDRRFTPYPSGSLGQGAPARARRARFRASLSGSGVRRRGVSSRTSPTASSRPTRHPGCTTTGRVPRRHQPSADRRRRCRQLGAHPPRHPTCGGAPRMAGRPGRRRGPGPAAHPTATHARAAQTGTEPGSSRPRSRGPPEYSGRIADERTRAAERRTFPGASHRLAVTRLGRSGRVRRSRPRQGCPAVGRATSRRAKTRREPSPIPHSVVAS